MFFSVTRVQRTNRRSKLCETIMRYLVFLLLSFLSFAQQTQKVDFKTATGNITITPIERKVFGSVRYVLEVKQDIDSIKVDAQNMSFNGVEMNGKEAMYLNSGKKLVLLGTFKKGKYTLTFTYEATPKQTLYFTGDFKNKVVNNQQVWTQGQGKYTSHWFPSFDDVNEKVVFNLNITFDKRFNVLSNGVLKEVFPNKDQKIWEYSMNKPMSSYLLAIVIGDFRNKVVASKSGIPLQLFIQPKDTDKFEPTYRHSKQIFDFMEKEIGVKYPWKIYKQIPVEDFLYAGMENTSSTIFAQDYVVDEMGFNDRNYINVNAHELAHQWFGDLVTAKSGKHHWLQEGFATYYALLAEKEIFGEDYFYYQLYKSSLQLKNAAKNDTIPVMNEKASSLSFYQKGAWALHVIRESIGSRAFHKAVKNYLKKYAFQNVETDNFLEEIRKVSNFDTTNFSKQWLENYKFNSQEVSVLLNKNKFIQQLVKVQKMRDIPLQERLSEFQSIMQSEAYFPVKTEILYQLKEVPFEDKKEIVTLALQTNNIKVRQAIAEFTDEIPLEFKSEYETLLDDKSYDTKEIALIKLFNSFPESQMDYLVKAKDWKGNNDLGLRTTVLLLTQIAKDYDGKQKEECFNELVNYTSTKYESSVRQSAIGAAVQAKQPIDIQVLKNLVNATTHFKWQFNKFAKEYIRELLKIGDYKNIFQTMIPQLPENEKIQLQKLLAE